MAEFKTVVKNYKRMCDSYKLCEGCPLTKDGSLCSRFMIEYPEEAEHTIMQWATENPIMTNGRKFEEVFGSCAEVIWHYECNAFLKWVNAEYKGGQNETD